MLDVTNTVSIGDARAVADAAERILARCFGAGSVDRELLHASFDLVARVFAGEHPGYLACDMPYHDLRHSLDTALVMARLIDGCQREPGGPAVALTAEHGLLGVLLGLLHDTGFIRTTAESALCGPQLMAQHEFRSVEFAGRYLRATALAAHAPLATLILATRLGAHLDELFAGLDDRAVALGEMLGTADLVSQMSDRCYPERCCYHLYPELKLGGRDRVRAADGQVQLLYLDGLDLLRKTPGFCEHVLGGRLERDLQGRVRHLAAHHGGADPYAEAIRRNLDRIDRMVAEARFDLLQDEPATTTRNLAAIYRARPPGTAPCN